MRKTFLALFVSALTWAQAPAPRDIISLSAPLTETLYVLGAQDRLAASSNTSVFPEQAALDRASGKVRTLEFYRPDMAVIDSIHPKLILTSTSFQKPLADDLRKRGYNVLHFDPASIEDIFAQTEKLGEAVDKLDAARAITAQGRRDLAEIAAKSASLPKVRVYIEINHVGPWTAGGRTTEEEAIRLAGGVNVFSDRPEGVFQTTNEEVVRRNPQLILSPIWVDAKVGGIDGITTLAEIMGRPGYASTDAVKDSRVLYYDSALLKHQGTREVLAIKKLAYLLHPEAFSNPEGTIPWELGRVRP